jgi:succinyl-diaminopimelate desuccinylase
MRTADDCNKWIADSTEDIIELETLLTGIPALGPENGGDGEFEKAEALIRWCRDRGLSDIDVLYAPDDRVASGKRPNVVVTVPGTDNGSALWIMSHLDIVPPGDLDKWETDPFTVTVKDGKIYGRGTEDNQQGMVSSIFALLAVLRSGKKPPRDIKLLFVADEEVGSAMGIQYLLREHDLFQPGDMFLVPDGGNETGTEIEIAEKSVVWLEFTLLGKQTHASRPGTGINAFVAGSELVLKCVSLHELYPEENALFAPPHSTFSPTKKEANVPNVNTIPGKDVFCLDSRILPSISVDEVLEKIDTFSKEIEEKYGVQVSRKTLQRVESRPTPADAGLVGKLKKAIASVYDVEAEMIGIGGGTVAAYLRNAGFDTAVWARLDERAHNPNEYAKIDNIIGDARVMLRLMLEEY